MNSHSGHFCYSLKLSFDVFFNKIDFLSLALLKIITNTSSSQKFGQSFDSDMPLEPDICVCI